MKKYIVILLCVLLWNCQEDELPLYSGKTCVYFSGKDILHSSKYYNEIGFSFGLTSVMDTVIHIPVTGTGDTVSYDRYFSFVLDSVTGQKGVHFDLPEKGVFPAGSANGYIPVALHRVLDDDSIYNIHFRLISDEEFEVNIPEAYYSGDTTDLTRFVLTFSSSIAKPARWVDSWLGYFSLAKWQVCYELTGQTWMTLPNASLAIAYKDIFKSYVESKILEGKAAALRDPQNKHKGEEGYMTMRGISGYKSMIPAEWFE